MGSENNSSQAPLVLIAAGPNTKHDSVIKKLAEDAKDTEVLYSEEELYTKLYDPRAFCVFLNDRFAPDVLKVLESGRKLSRALWILESSAGTTDKVGQRAIALGAELILPSPVNSFQYVLRSRQMLARFQSLTGQGGQSSTDSHRSQYNHKSRDYNFKEGSSFEASKNPEKKASASEAARNFEVYDRGDQHSPPDKLVHGYPKRAPELKNRNVQRMVLPLEKLSDEGMQAFAAATSVSARQKGWAQNAQTLQNNLHQPTETLRRLLRSSLNSIVSASPLTCHMSLISLKIDSCLEDIPSYSFRHLEWSEAFKPQDTTPHGIQDRPEIVNAVVYKRPVLISLPDGNFLSRAAIPLLSNERIVGMLNIEIEASDVGSMMDYLADVAAHGPSLLSVFCRLDFLARIYRPLELRNNG